MKRNSLLLLLLAGSCWTGCDVINPDEPVPTYVQIDSVSFIPPVDPIATAGYTNKITSCWAYYEGKTIGVFDLPAKIPVLADKAGKFSIIPGVVPSGIKDYQVRYPFYNSDAFTLEPKPGQIVTFKPKTSYVSDAKFVWKEDFEGGNDFAVRMSGDTDVVKSNMPAALIDGGYSGVIYMKSPQKKMEAISTSTFKASGESVYLELDYKCSMPFYIGIRNLSASTYTYVMGVNPRADRNKLYVSLSNAIANSVSTAGYKVLLMAELPAGQSDGFVAVDNMKIITFKE